MIDLNVNGDSYKLEFKHRKRTGKWPQLYGGSALNGLTTCAILGTHQSTNEQFVALGSSVCVRSDRFNQRQGRRLAFADAVTKCGLLRPHGDELMDAFNQKWPEPPLPAQRVKPPKLQPEQQQALRKMAEFGADKQEIAEQVRVWRTA